MDLQLILTAVGVFLGSAGGRALLDFLLNVYREHRTPKDGMSRALLATNEVYERLKEFCTYADADRVLLLRCNDSKDVPDPGAEIKSSVVFEFAPGQPIREHWTARVVDYEYVALLRRVLTDRLVTIRTTELPEACMLRAAYEDYGVKASSVSYVTETPGNIWYLSVSWEDFDRAAIKKTPQYRNRLEGLTSYLRDYLDG